MSTTGGSSLNDRLRALGVWEPRASWTSERSDHDNRLHALCDELEAARARIERLEVGMHHDSLEIHELKRKLDALEVRP